MLMRTSIFRRRNPAATVKRLAEMGVIVEPEFVRDCRNFPVGLGEGATRSLDANFQQILVGRSSELATEDAVQLADR